MAKETAEEKLLKMMQKTAPGTVPALKAAAKPGIQFSFSINLLNQLLLVGIIACIVLLAYEMRSGFSLINNDVTFSDEGNMSRAVAQAALPSSKKVSYYLEKVSARNIFRPYEGQAAKGGGSVIKESLAKRMSRYKLVGIAWLDLPETASLMIEDSKDKTTYFLKQGEQLEGVTVKTIYTDRAVLSYENEETIIKL